MAVPTLIIPTMCPVTFVMKQFAQYEGYNSHHLDDHHLDRLLLDWQQVTDYGQPWQQSDTLRIQFYSNYGPHVLKVIDEFGHVHKRIEVPAIMQDSAHPDFWVYEIHHSWTGYRGTFWLELECGLMDNGQPNLVLTSNRQDVDVKQPHTLLIEFKHFEFRENVFFETGYAPSFRIQGTLQFAKPNADRNTFTDQVYNHVLLDHKKYRSWNLHIGDSFGVPDYVIDKMESIFGCSEFLIDGRPYVVPENAKLENQEMEDYPMRGWMIEVYERYTKGGQVFTGGGGPGDEVLGGSHIILVVDSMGLGQDTVGGNEMEVQDIQ